MQSWREKLQRLLKDSQDEWSPQSGRLPLCPFPCALCACEGGEVWRGVGVGRCGEGVEGGGVWRGCGGWGGVEKV